jgi:uncharacterized membrane protein YfcA
MIEWLWLVPLGFAVGACGTLIGSGGGFILVPALLLLHPEKKATVVTCIALTVVFFNSLSGSVAYARMRRIDYRSGIVFAAATVPGAILGAFCTTCIERCVFDPLLACLLIVVSVALFLHPPRKHSSPGQAENPLQRPPAGAGSPSYATPYTMKVGIGLSVLVGFLSSLFGVGAGIIYVPAMVHILGFPTHVATATSIFVLATTKLTGALVHIVRGELAGMVGVTAALTLGALGGAQLGAWVSRRVRGVWIIRALAIGLGLVGLRILVLG